MVTVTVITVRGYGRYNDQCTWGVSCRYRVLVCFGTEFVFQHFLGSVHPFGGSLSARSLVTTNTHTTQLYSTVNSR